MMKVARKLISVFLVAGLMVALVYGYLWFKMNNFRETEPLKAIPEDAVIFLETRDFSRLSADLKNYSNIWNEFKDYRIIHDLDKQISEIDSLSRSFPEFRAVMETPLMISLNRLENDYHLLYILSPGKNKATEEILKLLSNEAGIDKNKFRNQTVYDVRFKNPGVVKQISFTETGGLLLLSASREMIEEAIRHLGSDREEDEDENFRRLRTTAGKDAAANIYINYPELSRFLNSLFIPGKVQPVSGFAQWSALDLELKPDQVILNGFTTTSDSLPQQLGILRDQNAVEFNMISVIPDNTVYFRLSGFSDKERLMTAVKDYFGKNKSESPGMIPVAYENDFAGNFMKLISHEAGELIVRSGSNYRHYFVTGLRSAGVAENLLVDWLKETADKNGKSLKDYRTELSVDNQNKLNIYHSPEKDMPSLLFPGLYRGKDYEYFGFTGNYMVFGESPEAVKEFLYLNILGKTLQNDEYFINLKDNLASRSNLFVYINPALYFEEILKLFEEDKAEVLRKVPEKWKKISALCFQSTSSEDLNYFHLFLNYSGEVREYVNTVWERKLDTISGFKPAIVLNHNNNEKEIFLQDKSANIYLINNSGSILWKQNIDGPILSEIFQIDYYGNGKLQYLFNTGDNIYLVDRNGNPVERYPVKLREEASAGLSVFDYDNDGDLRICIPTEKGDIYMYDREGRVISGWKFKKAGYPVRHPVQHVRIEDKDYIFAADKMQLHILDRRGRERVKPEQQIEFSAENPVYPQNIKSSNACLTATDTSGSVYNFFFDGRVENLFRLKLSAGHYFVPSDLNGDGKKEYVFADQNRLMVYSQKGELLFDENLPENLDMPPAIYEFAYNDKKIGIVARKTGKIFLFNNTGSLYQGFPLTGSSPFSISSFPGLKARFNLIVGNDDNFLYNYSVK